jgi:DNA-binding CsgD family transcriptional regulator/Tfp pilus assembly protein PilF
MLFGRDVERAHVDGLLDAVASGPVGCILEGVPGIGKTALWRESVEGARRRGYRVLQTAPSEPDALLAFSGLGDLFERVPDDVLDTLPDAQAHALRAALSPDEFPEGSRDQQALPRAILGALRQLCAAGPALIAIDDEQWLDPASARVLTFALCRLREEPIAVVLARRPEPGGMLSAELSHRFIGRGLETISLQPLPGGPIKMLLEARLGRTISRPLLRRIHQGTGGNPLYTLAIALELEARHADSDRAGDLPLPRTLSHALELRLGQLDPRANPAMLAIAALSQPTLGMLQAAIPEFALSDLESAQRAGVIEISGGRLRFTHPLLASTHYASVPISKRRELHRRLATVVDDEVERAQHLALGAEAPGRDIANSLERAAGVAARRGGTESAAQLLEDAARLTPIDDAHASRARIVAAAEHRFSSGEVSRARAMLEEVIPNLDSGPLRARARLQLAALSADEPTVAVELLEAALVDAGEDDWWRVKIESELTGIATSVGRLTLCRAHAESAVETAERLGDRDLVAKALGDLLLTFICTGEPMRHDVLARLSAMTDCTAMTTYSQPMTAMGLAFYNAGDLDAARPLLERAAQRALSRGEEWDRLGVLLTLAQLEWSAGRLSRAEQHRQEVEDTMGEFSECLPWLMVLDVRYALDRGDFAAAEARAEQGMALADRKGDIWHWGRLVPLVAGVELLSGRPEAAHARLAELREWLEATGWGPAGIGKLSVWSQDVEALIALGRLDEAEDVLSELRSRADACQNADAQAVALRCEALLLAARGDVVAAIAATDAALAAHARGQRPLEHGRTLLEKGSIERRAKRKASAKQSLEQALAMLEPLDAKIWVARARDELSRIGLRRARATEGLTPAQVRVAELVAAGHTNPEIAAQLHMSVRTVASHLSQVYREYGVSSRSQLAAALATPGPDLAFPFERVADTGFRAVS